jgi:glycerophosphoryl diester phosphodiesterase
VRPARTAAATAAFFVALSTTASVPAQAAVTGCPVVAAHRTAMLLAPENTVAGIRAAATTGAPLVEMDLRWSKGDGTAAYPGWPVLMHDPTVDRTTTATGNVADLGLTALTALAANDSSPTPGAPKWSTIPAYSGANAPHVPYAYDFLAATFAQGEVALLDTKVTPTRVQADKLMQYVDRFPNGRSRIIVMASAATVTAMRAWYPGLQYWFIEYPPTGSIRSNAYLKSLGITTYAVQFQATERTQAAVDYWHAGGLKVATWTSDTAAWDVQANWDTVAGQGVDYLITNQAAKVADRYATTCGP